MANMVYFISVTYMISDFALDGHFPRVGVLLNNLSEELTLFSLYF